MSSTSKPYRQVPIVECGEPLVPIPAEIFDLVVPHPYAKLQAPYGDKSPFYLRQGVLNRLILAQDLLQAQHPGWQIQVFDAYRPIAVQQFMVDYTFQAVLQERGIAPTDLSPQLRQEILDQVYEFWAVPSPDPTTPPPHSTGAAIDITLVDHRGAVIDMGSEIDELSPRSYPDHFANSQVPIERHYHQHRHILRWVMAKAGFRQHPNEWWHFSYGDQMWAWLGREVEPDLPLVACYGRCGE